MSKPADPLQSLRVAAPCPMAWEAMAGDDRVRHCTLCELNVYNFAEMTREEVLQLLARSEGRVCGRLYRRSGGTFTRMTRIAASVVAAFVSFSAFALEGVPSRQPRLRTHGAKVKLDIEHVLAQQAVFTGVVTDESSQPLPGVTVLLRDEASRRELTAVTDAKGTFTITLSDALYRVEVTLSGFRPAVLEHLPLKHDEVTHARVALRLDSTIVVGVIAADPLLTPGVSTFSKELIDKLPIP